MSAASAQKWKYGSGTPADIVLVPVKSVSVAYIAGISQFPHESELLLPPGVKSRVVKFPHNPATIHLQLMVFWGDM